MLPGSSGEGSSSGARPPATGFDWQDHQYEQVWTPSPMQSSQPWPQAGLTTSPLPVAESRALPSGSITGESTDLRGPATPYHEWVKNMHRVLENTNLMFADVDREKPGASRLFMAFNAQDPNDHNPSEFPSEERPSSNTELSRHFVQKLQDVDWVEPKKMNVDPPVHRVYVYANSRAKMDYISKHYFLGKMQFLPINVNKLTWNFLDQMIKNRERLLLLPPQTTRGLGIMVAAHDKGKQRIKEIQERTGELQDRKHIVSIWSPYIMDGSRSTAVFYGIGQMDMTDWTPLIDHLEGMKSKWKTRGIKQPFWDGVHHFNLPKDFIFDRFFDENHASGSELRRKAEERMARAAEIMRGGAK